MNFTCTGACPTYEIHKSRYQSQRQIKKKAVVQHRSNNKRKRQCHVRLQKEMDDRMLQQTSQQVVDIICVKKGSIILIMVTQTQSTGKRLAAKKHV